ncbi:phosphate ABC transporter substrate-binding protein PstS [Nocardia paucivorans]|uniref:phosphate ABC transporter substrate-binding protein PstS n=1 Tax=Nocardia paucivorans TaxID=114259 RepID=UPI0002F879EA|nr:phosphate ABC transporter substrate-binding protein PstS [Nocardia paucivorans]
MKFKRSSALVGALAAGAMTAMTLAACGSDDNTAAAGIAVNPEIQCGGKEALKASGSSAQANAMTRFILAYQVNCDEFKLDYTSSGSGAGVKEFIGGQTDFGGSDSPLKPAEVAQAADRCAGAPAWNLPTVFGPIAITYNIDGVTDLALDGPTVAKIFSGAVKTWDAPEIKALNPTAQLPAEQINVIFRSDESGTTDNFQLYLNTASEGAWGDRGVGKTFKGGVGEGAKGNEGTSAAVKNTENSITYNEWSYAKKNGLSVARIITSAGPEPVELSVETAGKAIDGAKIKGKGHDMVLDTTSFYNPTAAGAYPIILPTYEIVCSKYGDGATATAVKAFLHSAISNGQEGLEVAGYIPIPEKFKAKLSAAIDAIS